MEPLFILAGQSNMAGRCVASDLPPAFRSSNADDGEGRPGSADPALFLHGGVEFSMCWNNDSNFGVATAGTSDDQWLPLQCQLAPGLDHPTMVFGPEFGIATTLGPRLSECGITKACFLKYAMGSTNLHSNWNPENTTTAAFDDDGSISNTSAVGHYGCFIDCCRRHLADPTCSNQNSNRQLVGMFWLQGESDSSKAKDANAYLGNFQRFIAAVRRDLHCPDLYVVVSPIVWKGKKVRTVNQALQEAGNGAVEQCTCVPELEPDAGFGVQPLDAGPCAGHLTASSISEVGRRMGQAMPLDMT